MVALNTSIREIMNRSATAAREAGAARVDGKPPRMPIRLRRILVVLHVISSVGWLGLTIGDLVLAVTGMGSSILRGMVTLMPLAH
jgi:hypothetical protein